MNADVVYHLHDRRSSDARGTLTEYAEAARQAGLSEICLTNHAEVLREDGRWTVDAAEMVDRFGESLREAGEARRAVPEVRIRVGAEVEYRPEWTEDLEAAVRELPLDFVLGSVHAVDGRNVSGGDGVERFFEGRSLEEAYGAYFRALEEMVAWGAESGAFDAVAHLDLVKRYGHLAYGPYDPAAFEESIRGVLRRMATAGLGLEVNASGVAEAPGEPYPGEGILAWAREEGVPFLTVGTDAHAPDGLLRGLDEAAASAVSAGWTGVATFRRRRVTGLRPLSRPGGPRRAAEERESRETRVRVEVDLDGRGRSEVETGVGFFDHMLEQLARHALVDLTVEARGDLEVDAHHTVEDVGIVLGRALSRALGERRGVRRYGFTVAMDDARVAATVDLGGRSHVEFEVPFAGERVGEFPTELVEEFVRALARSLDATIHVAAGAGRNDHHLAEGTFKALARALRGAAERDPGLAGELPTTKRVL